MSKPSPPDPPDMQPVADASLEAAQMSYDIAQQQLAWAQEVYYSDKEYYDQIIPSLVESQEFANETAAADRERYEQVFQPLEDQYIAYAESYMTPERMFQEAEAAQAGVAQQFEATQKAAQQQLLDYGINVADVKYSNLNPAQASTEAAASAAAGQQAIKQTEATGIGLLGSAVELGRGYPGQSTTALQAGTQAGGTAGSTTAGATQTGSQSMTAPSAYINSGSSALGVGADALNNAYANEVNAYNAQLQASSGWGSALGSVLGAGMSLIPGMQEGGAIPQEASPSRGAIPDDVTVAAEAGEFVIPRRIVEWKGQEYFYKEIAKIDAKKQEMLTGAIPETATA